MIKGLPSAWPAAVLLAVGSGLHAQPDATILARFFSPRVYDELFDIELPGQYAKGQWSWRLNPRFGDFLDDDHVRVRVGARYNFSNYFDASSDVGFHFPNPLGDGSGSGVHVWRIGARYSWYEVADSRFNLAVGLRADLPLSNAPPGVGDRYARHEPYVSLSRRLTRHPDWLLYFNSSYRIVTDSPFSVSPIEPRPRNQWFLRPGLIWYPGARFRYSLELEYRTNAPAFRDPNTPLPTPENPSRNWILAHREVHDLILYPGITWFPARHIRDDLFIPGNWDLGLRLRIPLVDETAQGLGLSISFRWYYDYRKILRDSFPDLFARAPR
jgi:hypothetical protein